MEGEKVMESGKLEVMESKKIGDTSSAHRLPSLSAAKVSMGVKIFIKEGLVQKVATRESRYEPPNITKIEVLTYLGLYFFLGLN